MIYTLTNALSILIWIFYLNTKTLLVPMTFGYIYMLYGLKDLPSSKKKIVLQIILITGLLRSFSNKY